MCFTVKGCKITVEYFFILVLSFAVLLDVKNLIFLLLFSALHELGHLIMLILCGGKADSLTLSFYGLALKYSSKLTRIKEFAVIFAGPFINLLLFLFLRDDTNLILFVLNMLPIYPLDGGRLLRIYSYKLSVFFSKLFLVLIMLLSLYMVYEYKSFSLLLISVYLIAYSIMY